LRRPAGTGVHRSLTARSSRVDPISCAPRDALAARHFHNRHRTARRAAAIAPARTAIRRSTDLQWPT